MAGFILLSAYFVKKLSHIMPVVSGLILMALVIKMFRCSYGGDGANHIIVLTAGLTFAGYFPENDAGRLISMWFVTAQLIISHFTAGVAKIFGSSWRDGTGIIGVLSTFIRETSSIIIC